MGEVIPLKPNQQALQVEIEAEDGELLSVTTPESTFWFVFEEDHVFIVDKETGAYEHAEDLEAMIHMMSYALACQKSEFLDELLTDGD